MTLLKQLASERRQHWERARVKTLQQLRDTLQELLPASRVVVFGSLIKPGRFGEESDVDVALEAELPGMSVYQLSSLLAERLGRPVDVVLLPELRFRDKILRE